MLPVLSILTRRRDYYDPDPAAPDKTYAKRGGFLSPIPFEPLEHGIPPNVVPATDTSQLPAPIAARQVLDDAIGSQFTHVDREKVSVILGVTSAQELLVEAASRLQRPVWVKALREEGLPEDEVQRACDRIAASYTPWQEMTFPGLLGKVIAGRIANRLNLGGTNCGTDAACASSLSALAMAVGELRLGQSDLVITGGADTMNDIFMYVCFSKTPVDCAQAAFKKGLRAIRHGTRVVDVGRVVEDEVTAKGYAVVKPLQGHGIGRTIHEEPMMPNWPDPQAKGWLTDGLVITLEPIIAAGSGDIVEDDDGWTVRTRDHSLSAHHEHTLVVTKGAPLLLTAD